MRDSRPRSRSPAERSDCPRGPAALFRRAFRAKTREAFLVIAHDDTGVRAADEMAAVGRVESDEVIWRVCAIRSNRCHRYLLRKNKRRHMPHCPKPRVHEARYRRYIRRWRPADSVALQSQGKASPFCSKIIARFSGPKVSCSHAFENEDKGQSASTRQNEANSA